MPIVQKEGKDTIIFVTKEEHATPSTIELPAAPEPPSLILPSGEINWNCPCLGGMATGPCGIEFREAFSCFHYSTTEPKGSDCYEVFKTMQTCMSGFPALYGTNEGDTDESSEVLDLKSKDNAKDDIPRKKISLPTEKTEREEERPDKLSTNKEIKKTEVN